MQWLFDCSQDLLSINGLLLYKFIAERTHMLVCLDARHFKCAHIYSGVSPVLPLLIDFVSSMLDKSY